MLNVRRGFSLIELLVALAVLGILAAICYPSYQQYVLRTYRAEATAQLLQLAAAQEQYLADYGVYTDDLSALGGAALSPSQRYEFQILLSEANLAYEITAQASGLQRSDSDCLFYSVNQFGQRNVQYPHSLTCWD